MTADPLLSTRLQIPPARPDAVVRSRLVARLVEGVHRGHRLTLLSAPPGFGKTTLVREWAGVVEARVAWLAVDEGDNDPTRFVRCLLAALAQADDRLRQAAGMRSSPASFQEMLVGLINELAASGSHLLLVLDDYHLLSGFAVHDLVALLLEKGPSGLHVAIATREDPPLPLARLRARDQMTEIRERDLRFTSQEAALFLNGTMTLGLSPAAIATLTARTEGWITGLQLAGLALRQASSADEFVAAFAGDDRHIVNYLMAEVLDREPEAVHLFLRQTSILDRLCAPLCAAVTGRDDSQAILDQLEGANLSVVRLDNRRQWYRYHVLFAEVLRLSLSAQDQIELHKKAAAWYQAQGMEELARHHARLAAGPARSAAGPGLPLIEPLSEREVEVLRLIAAGLSNQEIADRLIIAPGTVKRHINNIYGKLGVQSRTQAVARGREVGLL